MRLQFILRFYGMLIVLRKKWYQSKISIWYERNKRPKANPNKLFFSHFVIFTVNYELPLSLCVKTKFWKIVRKRGFTVYIFTYLGQRDGIFIDEDYFDEFIVKDGRHFLRPNADLVRVRTCIELKTFRDRIPELNCQWSSHVLRK